ncbi:hypothetical protein GT348_09015 (plasmid) [Aristophania vespae]|uniref:Uncharacterized protein n=1 Tax=Aristophania vespae TaxID=2697033 RepID=A0A6P1NHY3_9PROT|nr:flagellar FliJ family protein [Aristophania vespae]QHI96487.1 hypothetical protein GT348_09015 [Aristophania vespae]UMM64826.1 hypothetical protein DM15PD_18460 [Aristophania vespae]
MSKSRLKALETLKRLQITEVDRLKSSFAECIDNENKIELSINDMRNNIVSNENFMMQHQSSESASFNFQQSYYEWLPVAQKFIAEKNEDLCLAQQNTELVRADMIKAKTSLEATEKLISAIHKEIDYLQERKLQTELDDIARNNFIKAASKITHR